MDIKLTHPFEDVNVTVDCGGSRVDGPTVNIDIVNGGIDANKSAVRITGSYWLHPFRSPAPDEGELTALMTEVERVFLAGAEVCADRTDDDAGRTLNRLVLHGTFCLDTARKLYPIPEPKAAATVAADPLREQAFKELVGLVIAKLTELTPYRGIMHAAYAATGADLVANAAQIVAQLKDSPTLAAVMRSLGDPHR